MGEFLNIIGKFSHFAVQEPTKPGCLEKPYGSIDWEYGKKIMMRKGCMQAK